MLPLLARALTAARGFMAGRGGANAFASQVMNGGAGQAWNSFQQGANGGGGTLGGLYQAAKDAAPPLIKLGMEVAEIPGKIQEWGRQLVESQRYLSQYNGTIAGATAQLDADRIKRDIELGSQTADSFQNLTESQSRLEEANQPWKAAWNNINNDVSAWVNNLTADIVEGISEMPIIGEALKYYSRSNQKDDNKDPLVNEIFHGVREELRKQNKGPMRPLR